MAEATATYLLSKIDNWLSRELRLYGSITEKINQLKMEHDMIVEFLKGADSLREEGNQQILVWIRHLRIINHEIETVIHMWNYHHAIPSAKPWYNRWPVMSTHSIDAAVAEVGAKLRSIKENKNTYANENAAPPASTSAEHEFSPAPLYTPEVDIVGVDGPRVELASWLLDVEQPYRARFVVGMGGAGKTALVKLVYEQLKMDFDCHVWLSASKGELLPTIYDKICGQIGRSSSSASSHDLIDMLREYLRDKRYLIVVDNWNGKDWESVKYAFPQENVSRVIVTTRRGDIACSCRDAFTDVYRIPPLPLGEALQLLGRTVFVERGVYPSSSPHLPEESEMLLKECEGLPLGIIEIGKVLYRTSKSGFEFAKLGRNLQDEMKLDSGKLSSVARVLLSSYYDLPYHLKCCFLYMAMFPRDGRVKCRTLIRLWMAEDFVTRVNQKEPEEIGEDYLDELMQRNLVLTSEMEVDGRPRSCRLHNLMHRIALSKSEAEEFCTVGGDISEKTRRLSMQSKELRVSTEGPLHLHNFFLSSSGSGTSIPRGIIPSMKLLKILHLDHAKLEALPKGIKDLLLLKYLSLSNTSIKQISVSAGRLKLLETLNVKQTYVTELPNSLGTVENLRHLLVGRNNNNNNINGHELFGAMQGVKVPKEIGKLTNLQKLSYVRADQILIKELLNLKKLRKLGIVDLPSESGSLLCQAIQKLTRLRSLSLASRKAHEVLKIQEIHSPPQLHRLCLSGRLEEMPQWISKLDQLVRVRLKWSVLEGANNPIKILAKLNNLLELQLLDAYTGDKLEFCSGTFRKLKILELDKMKWLQTIVIENGALLSLQKLTISLCTKLRQIPAGIRHIKELNLRDMPPGFVDPIKINGSLHYVVRNMKINSSHFQNGMWVKQDMP